MKVSIEKERMLVQGLLRRRARRYEWNTECDTGLSYVTQIQRFRPIQRESKTHTLKHARKNVCTKVCSTYLPMLFP